MEQEPCRRIGLIRIDGLGDSQEAHAVTAQCLDTVKAIADGTAKAVKFPN
jgi:hypothetical protein